MLFPLRVARASPGHYLLLCNGSGFSLTLSSLIRDLLPFRASVEGQDLLLMKEVRRGKEASWNLGQPPGDPLAAVFSISVLFSRDTAKNHTRGWLYPKRGVSCFPGWLSSWRFPDSGASSFPWTQSRSTTKVHFSASCLCPPVPAALLRPPHSSLRWGMKGEDGGAWPEGQGFLSGGSWLVCFLCCLHSAKSMFSALVVTVVLPSSRLGEQN